MTSFARTFSALLLGGAAMATVMPAALAQTSGSTRGSPGAPVKELPPAEASERASIFADTEVKPPSPEDVAAARQRSGAITPLNTFGSVSITPDGRTQRHDIPAAIRQRLQKKELTLEGQAAPGDKLNKVDGASQQIGLRDTTGASGPRNVHGTDERRRIQDTTKWPYRIIGRIATGCTGTLVGRRHVLTAAHCLYDLKNKTWRSNLQFAPGLNGNYAPHGYIAWKAARVPTAYIERGAKDFDIAMIVLDRDIGDKLGWMGVSWFNPFGNYRINISGYPGDLGGITNWASNCPIDQYDKGLIAYTCDTAGGMSGSAVYSYTNTGGTERRDILGVHTYGGREFNLGTRINREAFDLVSDWLKIR